MNDAAVSKRMMEELGYAVWRLPAGKIPSSAAILDVVEFLFQHVSKPTESDFHSYCGGYHPKSYDQKSGRYGYTVDVNAMFRRFSHPYALVKGQVKRRGIDALDAAVLSKSYSGGDTHLAGSPQGGSSRPPR